MSALKTPLPFSRDSVKSQGHLCGAAVGDRLSLAVSDFEPVSTTDTPVPLGILTGEGIGPEIIDATLTVLRVFEAFGGPCFALRHGGKIGKDALAESGMPLTPEVIDFCETCFTAGAPVLCGPGGARFVYELRRAFDLYCKLVPIRPLAAVRDVGVLRPESTEGVDILVVRENVGGLYFAATRMRTMPEGRVAEMESQYREVDVLRILGVAARAAEQRRGRLAVIVKPGATGAVSALWEDCASEVCADTGLDWQVLEVDNAAYQLTANPRAFDVVVASNMFGDVLADGASILLRSRGLSYSANFGPGTRAVYQTGHGAAHDLVGLDRANPIAQMLSAAMMLRESLGLDREACAMESAIEAVLDAGWRTPDLVARGCRAIGTRAMAERVAERLADDLAKGPAPV